MFRQIAGQQRKGLTFTAGQVGTHPDQRITGDRLVKNDLSTASLARGDLRGQAHPVIPHRQNITRGKTQFVAMKVSDDTSDNNVAIIMRCQFVRPVALQLFAQLKGDRFANARLWWPAEIGGRAPDLYDLTLEFFAADSAGKTARVSDRQEVRFGIREMTSEFTAKGAKSMVALAHTRVASSCSPDTRSPRWRRSLTLRTATWWWRRTTRRVA